MPDYITLSSYLSRGQKVAVQLLVDTTLIVLCFLAAMTIRLESVDFLSNPRIWLPLVLSAGVGITTFWSTNLYRSLVRFVNGNILVSIGQGVAAYALALYICNALLTAGIPRSVPFVSAVLLLISTAGFRFIIRELFRSPKRSSKKSVVIYGAGSAGLELLSSLQLGHDYLPIAFVDDDPRLQGLRISGYRVHAPEELTNLAEEMSLDVILLALPNASNARRRDILRDLEGLSLEVMTIPALSDIISGKAKISELRNVATEDLLGRDPVAPDKRLLGQNITAKAVMVTGAGGSIGSELCRQVLINKPKILVLFEISEFALYSIEDELRHSVEQLGLATEIVPVLGSVQDFARLSQVTSAFNVRTIYHAAAYKHVPLVEENVIEGIRNNVFGTLAIAQVAVQQEVENITLISTDKAVRPTNVMGASKRIAELICQAYAQEAAKTIFSIVRFGNVLGSSGSVIPRFRSQIESGGPVTVTHPDITRYFMTIPEASQLVIQAASMAKGGDVFVLDMGEAVKIVDLATAMIKLHGLTPYFVDSPEESSPEAGDIPVCFTGLRKGEKLYEELLIGNDPQKTQHPRIMMAQEVSLTFDEIDPVLAKLRLACEEFDLPQIRTILKKLPLEYAPLESEFADVLWCASQSGDGIEVVANTAASG